MKEFTETDVVVHGDYHRIYCEQADLVHAPLAWQTLGLQQTASGYGAKLTHPCKISYGGKLYRLYTTIYSNAGSTWFAVKGVKIYVD